MADSIEALTTRTLSLALDAASLKHQASASNIANHATPGYVPVTFDFRSAMAQVRASVDSKGMVDPAALAGVELRLQPRLDAQGAPAKTGIDSEMAEMAENALRYQALARALSKHMAIQSLAASDGKR